MFEPCVNLYYPSRENADDSKIFEFRYCTRGVFLGSLRSDQHNDTNRNIKGTLITGGRVRQLTPGEELVYIWEHLTNPPLGSLTPTFQTLYPVLL